MNFPAGTEAAVNQLCVALGVPAAVIHLHFSDDGKLQKIIPEMVFKAQKAIDTGRVRPQT